MHFVSNTQSTIRSILILFHAMQTDSFDVFLFHFISHRKSSRHIFSFCLVVQIEINVATMYSINCVGIFHYIWNRNLNTITMSHPLNRQSLYGIELGREAIQFFVMKNSEVI